MEFEIHPKFYNYHTDKLITYSKLNPQLKQLIIKNMTSIGYSRFLLNIINIYANQNVSVFEQYIKMKKLSIKHIGKLKFRCIIEYTILKKPKDNHLKYNKKNLLNTKTLKKKLTLKNISNYIKDTINHHYHSSDPYKVYVKSKNKFIAKKGSSYNFDNDSYSEIVHTKDLKKFKRLK